MLGEDWGNITQGIDAELSNPGAERAMRAQEVLFARLIARWMLEPYFAPSWAAERLSCFYGWLSLFYGTGGTGFL